MAKSKNNVEKTETQELSNADRLANLIKQREEVRMMLLKIQGAIELLQSMEGENVEAKKTETKSVSA
tara:strand:+ start:228 stop:428 length:201 start_codon:yes stop_codon:yes gene_type:complete